MNVMMPMQTLEKDQSYIKTLDIYAKRHNIFLDSDIGEPSEYRDFLNILVNSSEMDSINIYINCFGGNLDTTLSLVEGIKLSNANITAILMGACHSAASIIALNCDNIVILDNAYTMIHTVHMGYSGNVLNIKSHTDFAVIQIEKLIKDTYKGFLTKEEFNRIKNGAELWLNAEELRKRIKAKFKANRRDNNV